MVQDLRGRGIGSENDEASPSLTDAIFQTAEQRGPGPDEERARFEENQTFTGAGYKLENNDAPRPNAPDMVGRRNVTRELTFYANGFTVDDGPLRRFDDPKNEAFLSDVSHGVMPREMEETGIGEVIITLIDKETEHYVPPKKKVVPFSDDKKRPPQLYHSYLNPCAQSRLAAYAGACSNLPSPLRCCTGSIVP